MYKYQYIVFYAIYRLQLENKLVPLLEINEGWKT
jgi:hypothetical protein